MRLVARRARHARLAIFVAEQVRRALEHRFADVAMALITSLSFRAAFQQLRFSEHVGEELIRICRCRGRMRTVTVKA